MKVFGLIRQNVLFIILICFVIFCGCSKSIQLPERGVCAHRGASETHPENTLPAFQEAIRLGAHMIELDVRMTKDGELILLHDDTLDRTTNGKGNVSDFNLAEVKRLDAGAWKDSKFTGTRIPTLSEAIDVMPKNIWLNVHIKEDTAVSRMTAELLLAKKRQHQAFIACQTHAADAVRQVSQNLMICNMERLENSEAYVDSTISMDTKFIQLKIRSDAKLPDLVEKLKKKQIKINYYFADTEEKLKKLFKVGVDFPLVDNLEVMINAAKEIGIKPLKPEF